MNERKPIKALIGSNVFPEKDNQPCAPEIGQKIVGNAREDRVYPIFVQNVRLEPDPQLDLIQGKVKEVRVASGVMMKDTLGIKVVLEPYGGSGGLVSAWIPVSRVPRVSAGWILPSVGQEFHGFVSERKGPYVTLSFASYQL